MATDRRTAGAFTGPLGFCSPECREPRCVIGELSISHALRHTDLLALLSLVRLAAAPLDRWLLGKAGPVVRAGCESATEWSWTPVFRLECG